MSEPAQQVLLSVDSDLRNLPIQIVRTKFITRLGIPCKFLHILIWWLTYLTPHLRLPHRAGRRIRTIALDSGYVHTLLHTRRPTRDQMPLFTRRWQCLWWTDFAKNSPDKVKNVHQIRYSILGKVTKFQVLSANGWGVTNGKNVGGRNPHPSIE